MKHATLAGFSCWCPIAIALIFLSLSAPLRASPPLQSTMQHQVTGTITDSNGEPLGGVNIVVSGKRQGTISDFDGTYTITASSQDTLTFSFIGFKTVEIPVNAQATINIQLVEDVTALNEVTVNAGYYTVSEKERTGSISRITSEDIEKQPVSNPLAAMQGRMPGVDIRQSTGVPGGGFSIQIRGRNSIAAGNNPLYIIDGVPVSSERLSSNGSLLPFEVGVDPLNTINPANIASIEILKDADATSIYGSRGANGVVLITTKKGSIGKTRVDVNIQSGIGNVSNKMNLLNTEQFLEMRKEAFLNDGEEPGKGNAADLTLWDQNRYTDWQEELFGRTAYITDVQSYVSGGNQQTSFRFGGGVRKESTVFPGDFGYRKIMGSLNLSHTSENQKLRAELSITYGKDKNTLFNNNLAQNALKLAPNAPTLYDTNGDLNWEMSDDGVSTFDNPLASTLNEQNIHSNNFISNAVLSYEIIKDLSIKVSAGYTDFIQEETVLTTKASFAPEDREFRTSSHLRLNQGRASWIIEPQINYNKTIKNSRFEFLTGTTWQRSISSITGIYATGYNSDLLLNNLNATAESRIVRDQQIDYKYSAVYGRLGYNVKKKYFINLTGRRDGSSRFGPGKQFANFGAVGAAWIFTEEPFIKKHLSFLSFGKIRGSYGATGNDGIPDYGFLSTYSPITQPSNFRGDGGLYPTRLANPDYSWEVNKKLEGALDLGFVRDRILLSINWYRNKSSNQLVGYRLPYITGFNTIQANLPATVQNTGWELQLTTTSIQSPSVTWTTNVNLTIPKNKLVDFPNIEATPYASAYEIGAALNIRKLYQFQGVDPETGLYQVVDVNEDGSYNQDDRVAIINMDRKYYGGLHNTLAYKGWQLDFLLEYVKPNGTNYLNTAIIPGFDPNGSGGNQIQEVMDRWRSISDDTNVMKFTQSFSNYTPYSLASNSTLNITDASFIRLKNISLSYNFHRDLLEKLNLKHLRVSLLAQNLWTWTNYFGLDPQSPGSPIHLPALRMITASIQLQF